MEQDNQPPFGAALTLLAMAFIAFVASGGLQAAENPPPAATLTRATPAADHALKAVQETITQQLAAIRQRNAAGAFVLTTKDLHGKFSDPEKFLNNMRFTYRPIYNHDTFRFLDPVPAGDAVLQKVEVSGEGIDPALVIFRLEDQGDGTWLIDSFTILDDSESQPI